MALSKTTRDHDEIRKWAEARGAVPAEVRGTERGDEPGIIRFEFPKAPNHNDSKLEEISWEDFFAKFDERGLELIYQDRTADGEQSNFNKLVYPENDKTHGSSSSSGGHSRSHSSAKSQSSSSQKSSSAKKHKAA
jgi:hypothetical protein